jgi:hypothetical protein
MTPYKRIVDLDKLKIPFAIDVTGKWVKAPEVDLAAPPIGPVCPGCGEPVVFRRGSISRIPHFAHRPNSTCSNEGYEGLSHSKLKEATAILIDELGAEGVVNNAPAELLRRTGATLEEQYPGTAKLRSDVGVPISDGKIAGFEIIVSSELSIRKINEATAPGNLVFAMNGFEFTEIIINHGGDADFDIDADAKAFVLKWKFSRRVGTPAGTRTAKPAGVEFVGGTAVNCDAPGGGGLFPIGGAPLVAGYETFLDADFTKAGQSARSDPLHRQHALREWHRNASAYPRSFAEHWTNGDFDHLVSDE